MGRLFFIITFSLFSFIKGYCYDFSSIDNLINNSISQKYFPGAQLIIGSSKEIFYEKYYGHYTYDSDADNISSASLYDIASVTKAAATTSAIMKLYEEGKIKLDDKVSDYLPDFAANKKGNITILNLLVHNSGLKAWVPFYKTCTCKDDIIKYICDISLEYKTGSKFIYSDLNFIILGVIVEKISGVSLNDYCKESIFKPLGMEHTTFLPSDDLKKFTVPTEYDSNWRKRQLNGEVHDEAASLMGGVSGNAGLFSNARELFTLTRMLANNGKYYNPFTRGLKEERMFSESTVKLFTQKYDCSAYDNTRALGWDTKQPPVGSYRSQCGELISENCFGHTGYTGTSIWYDRDRDIIIIFLTNRVYPSRDNNGIKETRPELHNLIIKTLSNK
ncbi:MAG: serine hydrolase [Ignavibacteria bacterium]|nr:serine hydrolase [Ignavibacteria bacterium]